MRFRTILSLLLLLSVPASGQVRREIRFPDPPGYKVLKCDFHMHTVFSDGEVLPTVRVNEAWREGLDAIAITDHIEYQPHKSDFTGNHNRPYELAVEAAKQRNILLVRGAEITRDTPPGHFNVFFTKDNQPLDNPDFYEVFNQAAGQGAFVMWNHPGWQGEERGRWGEAQTRLLERRQLHGIEICNGGQYYIEAHRMAMQRGSPIFGSSDLHEPAPTPEQEEAGHRTMTLVLAKERTLPALREALDAGRTIVWYRDLLIGHEPHLRVLFDACVQVDAPHHRQGETLWLQITNRCDAVIELERVGPGRSGQMSLPANRSKLVELTGPDTRPAQEVTCKVTNFLVNVSQPLEVQVTVRQPVASAPAR
jgi:3',5'-nucleoside bisphosphate phosphatase